MIGNWRLPRALAAVVFCLTAAGCEQKLAEEKSIKAIEAAPPAEKSPAQPSDSAAPSAPEANPAERPAAAGN